MTLVVGGGYVNDWAIGLSTTLLGALLALGVPLGLLRWRRRRGPIRMSLALDDFEPYGSPQVFLVPAGGPTTSDAPDRRAFREALDWDRKHGVALGWQSARLTLRGLSPSPVVINDVNPVVLKREAPLAGWFVAPELGGGVDVRLLVVDLDDPNPQAFLLESEDDGAACLRRRFAFKVSDVDVEQFEVAVLTTKGCFEWGLDISYESDGQLGLLKVRDGRLRVTAVSREQQRAVTDGPDGRLTEDAEWGYSFADTAADTFRVMPRT